MVKRSVKIMCVAVLLGCGANAFAAEPKDPYEGFNRAMFTFNEKADQYVMTPVARGYRKVTPKPVRSAIGNFFNNLRDVVSFGSNILRGNLGKAGADFLRVAVNTTFGLGGLIDIADAMQMPNNKNNLGDTLASWGWKNSHYLVLPLVGPTTVRDGLGNAVTTVYSPSALIHENPVRYSLMGVNAVQTRENLLDTTDTLNEMALDKYVVMRNTYMNYRNQQVGNTQAVEIDDDLFDPENMPDVTVNPQAASEPTIAAPQLDISDANEIVLPPENSENFEPKIEIE